MLSREYRLDLRKNRDFFATSKRFFTKDLTFFYLENENQEHWQAAVIVPKKVCARAVDRHKFKRLIAQKLREKQDELPQNWQIAVVATGKIEEKTLEESIMKICRSQK